MKKALQYLFYTWMAVLIFTIAFAIVSVLYGLITGKI